MSDSELATEDVEAIAAFIDRRLTGKERRAFLERLDCEPALYEVFVETVRDRESGGADEAAVIALPERRGGAR